MGVNPTQRALEGGAMFFSAKYTRATAAVLTDFVSGGIPRKVAQDTITSMLVGGLATYIKFATAIDQEPELDPTSGKFLTFRVGNDRVGIGSLWVQMARLAGSLATDPQSALSGEGIMQQTDKPANPIARFMRNRLAPLSSVGADVWFGKDAIGEPFDRTLPSLAGNLGNRMLPFILQAYISEKPRPDVTTAPFNIAGMRTFPQSYKDQQDKIAQETFQKPYADLQPDEAQTVTEKVRAIGLPIRGEENITRNEVYQTYNDELADLYTKYQSNSINKSMFRQLRGEATQRMGTRLGDLEKKFPVDPTQQARREANMSDNEKARQKYLDLMSVKDDMGKPDIESADAFLSSQPQSVQDYVEGVATARVRNLPPQVQALELERRAAMKTLKPYWDIRTQIMKRMNLNDQYEAMTPVQQEAFAKTAKYRAAMGIWQDRQDAYRYKNPVADKALEEWYGRVPIRKRKS
jgi:hypothetical protein